MRITYDPWLQNNRAERPVSRSLEWSGTLSNIVFPLEILKSFFNVFNVDPKWVPYNTHILSGYEYGMHLTRLMISDTVSFWLRIFFQTLFLVYLLKDAKMQRSSFLRG